MVEPPATKPSCTGTPQVEAALEVHECHGYRERNAIQELSFNADDHGGSISTMVARPFMGPDGIISASKNSSKRLWRRPRARGQEAKAVTSQQAKVAESEPKGIADVWSSARAVVTLEHELKDQRATGETLLSTPPPWAGGQRADRDFRKQTIMTMRTLFLENMLRAFWQRCW